MRTCVEVTGATAFWSSNKKTFWTTFRINETFETHSPLLTYYNAWNLSSSSIKWSVKGLAHNPLKTYFQRHSMFNIRVFFKLKNVIQTNRNSGLSNQDQCKSILHDCKTEAPWFKKLLVLRQSADTLASCLRIIKSLNQRALSFCAITELTSSSMKIFFKCDDFILHKSLMQIINNSEILEKKHWVIKSVAKNLQIDQSLFIETYLLACETFLSNYIQTHGFPNLLNLQ